MVRTTYTHLFTLHAHTVLRHFVHERDRLRRSNSQKSKVHLDREIIILDYRCGVEEGVELHHHRHHQQQQQRQHTTTTSDSMVRKKLDSRIRTLIERSVVTGQRSMLVLVGDHGKDQVPNLHQLLSRTSVRARPSVLWCYKKELGFSTHRMKVGCYVTYIWSFCG